MFGFIMSGDGSLEDSNVRIPVSYLQNYREQVTVDE